MKRRVGKNMITEKEGEGKMTARRKREEGKEG